MEEETITVLALREFKRFGHFGEVVAAGDVIELSRSDALDRILGNDVEPFGLAPEYFPIIPPGGCTIDEALSLHLKGYRGLQPLLDRLGREHVKGPIYLRHYTSPQTWGGIPPDIIHDPRYRKSAAVWETRGDSNVQHLKVAPEPLDSRFDNALLDFMLESAIYSFIMLLREGRLIANGVAEADRTTFERRPTPVELFDENVMLNLYKGEIWEMAHSNADKHVRLWSTVVVLKSAEPKKEPVGSGRPLKSRDLWEAEFRRRCNESELLPTIKQEANWLCEWLVKTHPDAEVPEAKTISNRLSAKFSAEFKKELAEDKAACPKK